MSRPDIFGKERMVSTNIRRDLSDNNPYYISKHRRYELEHFCMQYSEWRDKIAELNEKIIRSKMLGEIRILNTFGYDPTGDIAVKLEYYKHNLEILKDAIEKTSDEAEMRTGIFKAVTKGITYTKLKSDGFPYCKNTFYNHLHKFYYILDKSR